MANPILVAEDSPNDLEFTLFALEKCRVPNSVVVVRDGEEALDYLFSRNQYAQRNTGNPALILLDLKMPKVDGLEVLKTIRATPHLASIPVIVLTHSALNADIERANQFGIDRCIIKPIEIKQFVADVCRAVSKFAEDKC
jgi:CheY-like chemotaxis protein